MGSCAIPRHNGLGKLEMVVCKPLEEGCQLRPGGLVKFAVAAYVRRRHGGQFRQGVADREEVEAKGLGN